MSVSLSKSSTVSLHKASDNATYDPYEGNLIALHLHMVNNARRKARGVTTAPAA